MTSSLADLSLDQLSIDTLRLLAVDAVEKAKSGHPGAPLGCAPIAYLLFNKLMKHSPSNSKWADRDRFVLSNGHASALLYGSLFLSGYNVTLEDLKSFRQWHSRTPGHPERGDSVGRGTTSGLDWTNHARSSSGEHPRSKDALQQPDRNGGGW